MPRIFDNIERMLLLPQDTLREAIGIVTRDRAVDNRVNEPTGSENKTT